MLQLTELLLYFLLDKLWITLTLELVAFSTVWRGDRVVSLASFESGWNGPSRNRTYSPLTMSLYTDNSLEGSTKFWPLEFGWDCKLMPGSQPCWSSSEILLISGSSILAFRQSSLHVSHGRLLYKPLTVGKFNRNSWYLLIIFYT